MSKKFTFQGVLEGIIPNVTFKSSKGEDLVKSYITFDDSDEGKSYPSQITFELFGAKLAQKAEHLTVGKTYEVRFNLRSRTYNGAVYSTISAYDVIELQSLTAPVQQPPQPTQPLPPTPERTYQDNLPF